MNKILSFYGLKWNPFLPDVPSEALYRSQKVEHFAWRVEEQVRDGGFALIAGDPGTGKSCALRIVAQRLSGLREVVVAALTHPQSGMTDFYRELGHLFGVDLKPHNRWGGFVALRNKWRAHVESTMFRPVLLVDEGQECRPQVLSELRLLASTDLDARSCLTVVLAADHRLTEKLRSEELLPLSSRIRARLNMEYATPAELAEWLHHTLNEAGNAKLMTDELIVTLCEHACGNYRALCTMAGDLLAAGMVREARLLDEKLYLDVFAVPNKERGRPKVVAGAKGR